MALDPTEQELFDFAWQAMPRWYRARERAREEISMFAKMWGAIKKVGAFWHTQGFISNANLASGTEPNWLELHAQDRGTHIADGETATIARKRLVQVPDAVTPVAILSGAQAIVDAAGVLGTVTMAEMPRDVARMGHLTSASITGGTFSRLPGSTTAMVFVPSTPPPFTPYAGSTTAERIGGRVMQIALLFTGCANPANDGVYSVSGILPANDTAGAPTLTGLAFEHQNGVAGIDATCTCSIYRMDYHGATIDNAPCAFVNRGFRVWRSSGDNDEKCANGGVVVMLPYGCTEGVRLAVREMLRIKMAAGFRVVVERAEVETLS